MQFHVMHVILMSAFKDKPFHLTYHSNVGCPTVEDLRWGAKGEGHGATLLTKRCKLNQGPLSEGIDQEETRRDISYMSSFEGNHQWSEPRNEAQNESNMFWRTVLKDRVERKV